MVKCTIQLHMQFVKNLVIFYHLKAVCDKLAVSIQLVQIYAEMIGNVMVDARSTGKYYHCKCTTSCYIHRKEPSFPSSIFHVRIFSVHMPPAAVCLTLHFNIKGA